uniref:Uncharacterized protein n=1 Tax=Panagrolaimus davidi TaxID=227884 RepID=A0A914Q8A2_9BILA
MKTVKEMDLLEPGTKVFKIVGPTLIKQYLYESKNTVNKRLEYINDDINRCEKSLDDVTKLLAIFKL